MDITERSIAGAAMIAVIWLLRKFFSGRLPKGAFLLLWEMTLLRLLLPFELSSPFSVYNFLPEKKTYIGGETVISHGAAVYVSPWEIIRVTGTAVCFAAFIVMYISAMRKFRLYDLVGAVPKELSEIKCAMGIRRNVRVRCGGSSPLTYGIFRPVIILPPDIKTEEMGFVLTHELIHIRRFDMIRKLAAAAALCLHWFDPLVWVMYFLYNRDIELFCDETLIRLMGTDCRRKYAETIIGMKEKQSGAVFSNGFSGNETEERITEIMKVKKSGVKNIAASALIAAALAAAFITSAAGAETEEETFIPPDDGLIYSDDGVPVPRNSPHYPVNARGESYGSAALANYPDAWPDLISAVGDNGIQGYIKKTDSLKESPSSPEEAVKMMKQRGNRKPQKINLYADDGETVIGTFTIGVELIAEQNGHLPLNYSKRQNDLYFAR